MTDSQLQQLLEERQQQDQDIVDVDEPVIKLVIFDLGQRHFAFAGHSVQEVLPGSEPVHLVPGMPASVEGVMNVRGDIVSVIRLHDLLQLSTAAGMPDKKATASILLGQGAGMHSGLRVDQLLDVVDVPESQIQPAPESLPDHLRPYVTGLLDFDGLAVTLLDLDAIFAAWLRGKG
ncbi:chemotaxis protein CheW [Marinospirillum alkaliphilum]|uniref:Purine-binding chemotaxis protein CheW n=1 Tax=Marinospirillum alkaliphilum DSM 21637 TaxID=1122209 RepID=A0A1K1XR31_9GAMM|nr:chemotaxis protein CheW [Marinospirillum alkaliphilum]SFX52185.1 purine-binding chemotaxis protein CheW [Marinospirillum alkaliphilum DSM 21637]